jgi:Zn-dependent protease with chaperone function
VTATTDVREHHPQESGATAANTASPSSPSSTSRSSRRDAGTPLEGLRGSIAPPAISPLYRLGLAAVLVLLVLLPLIYLALMAGVAWLTWLHATQNVTILSGRGGRGRLLVYVAPLAAGVLMLLFMIKPILARRDHAGKPIVLKPDQEPMLFAFIARICNILKAPVPSEVAIDCQVNASASFRRGLESFGSNDLTLTIGLPLAAGLNSRELAGVLAHELGHFAQGAGMRATYLIRTINGMFARIVYERDEWDVWLQQAKNVDFRLTLVIWFAQAGIGLNRLILKGLMMLGHACSCFMLRQMEYDADRYEIELAGTDTFISTSEKMPLLSVALMNAFDDAQNALRTKKVPDDLTALMTHHDALLSKVDRDRLLDHQRQEKTGLLDTHPSMRDRVAAARRLGRKGLYRNDAPATTLFRDFAESSRAVTLQHYELVGVTLGEGGKATVVSSSEMAADTGAAHEANKAYEGFFGRALSASRPFPLPSFEELESLAALEADADPDAWRERFRTAYAAARTLNERANSANDSFRNTLADKHMAQRAGVLIDAGFKLPAADWRIPEATPAGVERALKTFGLRIDKQMPVLAESDQHFQAALTAGLSLIARASDPADEAASVRDELQRLMPVFGSVSRALDDLFEISVYAVLLQGALEATQQDEEINVRRKQVEFLTMLTERLEGLLQRVDEACGDVRYPFDSATGEIALYQYLFGQDLPDVPTLAALVRALRLMDTLPGLQVRLLGRFAQMAQAAAA